ncbi:unnamed protein product [Leptidea sinapis]|uniref:Glycoside hydrolase family 38 central domain-containing protein n=1 Tax=Leptidea sinapis TaxID=189913 RepID=A0A5E4PW23_9NEOP|nr:unnamed protein product [Leptidea sinapis]VVD01648.1 unnamed protein product [Leptidea sinapis]
MNLIKKLQFYPNLTFTWNEVSHLSYWWKSTNQKNRMSLRRLLREGRLELTTGCWVQTDEATSSLFGILHQFIEGHQWLHFNLNYKPKLGWLTSSFTHSPTIVYILSALNINNLVLTNLHYSLEEDLAEFQHSDFIWTQSWDKDKTSETQLNHDLKKMDAQRFPKHAVLTHYLQYNSDDFRACGPQHDICSQNYDFAHKNLDINDYNVKEKSEILLEQYSKTGSISRHNTIIVPIGATYRYDDPTEFDYQYSNYIKITNFINSNHKLYKATAKFGVPSDYFKIIMKNYKTYPTVKGDFLNFADIHKGTPAYWTGYFTNRPQLKILLRRLEGAVRTSEVLFSFASSLDSFKNNNESSSNLIKYLTNVREILARLQDRNVVSGTLTAKAKKYVLNLILKATKECWYIQETAASLLTSKPGHNGKYLHKYIFRQGEFISSFKTIMPGDQLYVFNSLSHEHTGVIEFTSRNPNLRVIDHNKKDLIIQIEPKWSYTGDKLITISRQFFKIIFAVTIPPMTFELFKVMETYDTPFAATVFCGGCIIDAFHGDYTFPFNIQPIKQGDIQLENYKLRLMFDEFTGLLKTVVEKETNYEKYVVINFGAFKSSSSQSGMFLFKTNSSQPLEDILKPYRAGVRSKTILIISGQVTTEFNSIYDNLLKHSVKIYNMLNNSLANVIRVENKVDYDVSPKHRELEMFMSVQTIIGNGNPPEIFIDNNGFEYTSRLLNISRPLESNMYPMTSIAFIQDSTCRLTIITDHAQGVTALEEGQLLIMLDRRVLYNDGRGVSEGLADSGVTTHTNYILLENFKPTEYFDSMASKAIVELPSLLAIRLANSLNYPFDLFYVDKESSNLCYYQFLPLVNTFFPCDIFVINFRSILIKKYSKKVSNAALMILHRQCFSCRLDYYAVLHCGGERSFDIRKLFRQGITAYHTNLAGTREGSMVSHINYTNLPVMELMSVLINF